MGKQDIFYAGDARGNLKIFTIDKKVLHERNFGTKILAIAHDDEGSIFLTQGT